MSDASAGGRPRIEPVSAPEGEQAEALAKAPVRPDGSVRNIFLTLAHHPMLLGRFNAFAGTFIRFGRVPVRDRELLILRVAGRIGSRYEFAQHLDLAREAGIDDGTIRAVLLQPGAPPLADEDAQVVEFADEMLAAGDVSDATWEGLVERYGDDGTLLELLLTLGFYRMTGEMLNTVGVEVEDAPELKLDWSQVEGVPRSA